MSAAQTKAEDIISNNAVGMFFSLSIMTRSGGTVFSKSYCPYCKATKALLSSMDAKFYAIELDQVDDGSDIQAYLKEKTNQSSVPNIFINKEHIGGNSDIQAIDKDELKTKLKELNVIEA
ncbi:Glutaredoxin Grx1 protein [Rutstroemia sp. NJR-2017a BVV2]|nr:Glutaredoxin Grx1 protein [Rutstroemia sp. NJR-2017a BVV2]